jgi:hypothetical protein
MPDPPFYRPLTDELCQGDIFERVPLAYLKDEPLIIRKATLPGKREGYEVASPFSLTTSQPKGPILVPASCDCTRALLLTFDCEIDKPSTKVLTFALIRPLDPTMPEADQTKIRGNRKFAFFFLPAAEGTAPAGYVDFRRLGTVGIEVVKAAARIARLSEASRKAMLFQFFRYLTRIDLYKASLPPPEEEAEAP